MRTREPLRPARLRDVQPAQAGRTIAVPTARVPEVQPADHSETRRDGFAVAATGRCPPASTEICPAHHIPLTVVMGKQNAKGEQEHRYYCAHPGCEFISEGRARSHAAGVRRRPARLPGLEHKEQRRPRLGEGQTRTRSKQATPRGGRSGSAERSSISPKSTERSSRQSRETASSRRPSNAQEPSKPGTRPNHWRPAPKNPDFGATLA